MKNLIKTDFDLLYEDLETLYEANNDTPANYRSPTVDKILSAINQILKDLFGRDFNVLYNNSIKHKTEYFNNSAYVNVGTSVPEPETPQGEKEKPIKIKVNELTAKIRNQLKAILGDIATKYVRVNPHADEEKKLIIFWFAIDVEDLPDNRWTADDLDKYGKDLEVTARLNDLAGRMYTKEGDTREPQVRWQNFKDAKDYENALNHKALSGIADLNLVHDNTSFSLVPDTKADFHGNIGGTVDIKIDLPVEADAPIEGKSIVGFKYESSTKFADFFNRLMKKGTLGHLHNDSKYVLLVDKTDGKVVCVSLADPKINWLAGGPGTVKFGNN